jgi:hypothetical protein
MFEELYGSKHLSLIQFDLYLDSGESKWHLLEVSALIKIKYIDLGNTVPIYDAHVAKSRSGIKALHVIFILQTTDLERCPRQLSYAKPLFICCLTPSTNDGKACSVS